MNIEKEIVDTVCGSVGDSVRDSVWLCHTEFYSVYFSMSISVSNSVSVYVKDSVDSSIKITVDNSMKEYEY